MPAWTLPAWRPRRRHPGPLTDMASRDAARRRGAACRTRLRRQRPRSADRTLGPRVVYGGRGLTRNSGPWSARRRTPGRVAAGCAVSSAALRAAGAAGRARGRATRAAPAPSAVAASALSAARSSMRSRSVGGTIAPRDLRRMAPARGRRRRRRPPQRRFGSAGEVVHHRRGRGPREQPASRCATSRLNPRGGSIDGRLLGGSAVPPGPRRCARHRFHCVWLGSALPVSVSDGTTERRPAWPS